MPFALILLGILAFVAAYKNTLPELGALLKGDFSGQGNFMYWLAAMFIVGGIGYYKPLQNTSKMLMLLILIVMILSDKGFFNQFVTALNAPAPAANPDAQGLGTSQGNAGGGNSDGGGKSVTQIGQDAAAAAEDSGGNPYAIAAAVALDVIGSIL